MPGQITYTVETFPSQRKFYDTDVKYKGFSGPVGSGKSYALCYEALISAKMNPGCPGLIGAPTYPMLRDSTVPAMLSLLEKHRIPYVFNSTKMSLWLPRCQVLILFRSLEKFDRLRGLNLAWFGIDELSYCKKAALDILKQRIRNPKAKRLRGFAVWTPKGFDWVYDMFISPTEKQPGHDAIIAKPGENKAILAINPNYYEDLKHGYDELFYRQEALGEYLNVFSGRAYVAYDGEKNDVDELEYNPHKPLAWCVDFNLNPMNSVIVQDMGGRLNVIDEVCVKGGGATITRSCDRLEETIKPWKEKWHSIYGYDRPFEIRIYGDASGTAGNRQTAQSDYAAIEEYFRRRGDMYKLNWCVPKANPPVKDRVAAVNRMLCDATGLVRITIAKKCKELRADLTKVGWKKKEEGWELDKKSDDARTHSSDAFGYLCYTDYKVDAFRRELVKA